MKSNGTAVITTDTAPGGSDDKYGQQAPTVSTSYDGEALEVPLSYMANMRMSTGDSDVKRHSRLYDMAIDVETLEMNSNVTFTRDTGAILSGHIFDIDTSAQMVTVRWQ